MNLFKKCLPVIIAWSALTSSSLAFASHTEVKKRCSENQLDPVQAEQRVNWAIKCAKANGGSFFNYGIPKYASLLYEHVFDDDFNVIEYRKRDRPLYPIFTTDDLLESWADAPVTENATCDVPRGYVIRIFCQCDPVN